MAKNVRLRRKGGSLDPVLAGSESTVTPPPSSSVNRHAEDSERTAIPSRLAAVDIGSNSLRMAVVEYLPGGQFRLLDEERESPRLAKSLSTTGCLAAESIEATIDALRRFQKIARGRDVDRIHVIATCAVREASNGRELCDRVRDELGMDIEVITSEREAELAFLSVQRAFDIRDRNLAIADLGGGSMEVVFASEGHIEAIFPTRLGVVRVSEMCAPNELRCQDRDPGLVRALDQWLKEDIPQRPFRPQELIGTGGTFTTIAAMSMAARKIENVSRWGYTVRRAEVRHLLDRLQPMTIKQRRSFPGLQADRADIIVAGLAIVERLMRYLRVNTLRVHDGGVRDGLLRAIIEETERRAVTPEQRRDAVIQFARGCRVEMAHALKVADLALQIFDQLRNDAGLPCDDRELLFAAALLQDVGHLISYEKHQKHSYHLILHSKLPGFRRDELELVANVARYHRGARPKQKHENYRRLTHDEQRRVAILAGILRLAAGLDRSHTQQVERVDLHPESGWLELRVHSRGDPEVDLWAAQSKGKLLARALDATLLVKSELPSRTA